MTPINVPAPVVPYVPISSQVISKSVTKPPKKPQITTTTKISKKSSSADFDSFTEKESNLNDDYVYDLGYVETDRIDIDQPMANVDKNLDPSRIDPHALLYSANSRPYGEQFPSYLPKTISTMVGTMNSDDLSKTFGTGDSVVYGKFPEGAQATKDLNIYSDDKIDRSNERMDDDEYYEDNFEYYDDYYYEEDLQELKAKLDQDTSATSETKMSFLQLLNNLKN